MTNSFESYFEDLPDPRIESKCKHKLLDIVMLAICATIAEAETWQEIELFGKIREDWLRQWLELPNGIPSHDTIERVFNKLDSQEFESRFVAWANEIFQQIPGQLVAIDGKSLRGNREKLHLVSAWASASGISLGQCTVDKKSNEITAIPELLEMLILKDNIVTLDAMGCQKEIAQAIVDKKADYVLTVKGNQGKLHHHIQERFAFAEDERFRSRRQIGYAETLDDAHGRIERRQCWVLSDKQAAKEGWKNAQTLVRITCHRTLKNKDQQETRYFISSLPASASLLLGCVRAHWAIENSFHWVLDVIFREDENQTQNVKGAVNLSILRRIALNLVKRHPSKGSLKRKRYRAALDTEFLLEVLRN